MKAWYDADYVLKEASNQIDREFFEGKNSIHAKVKNADGEICLFIDKKCEKLLYNIYNLKYKEGSSRIDIPTYQQIKQSKELKFLSHPMDAASYLVDFYWPIKL